MIFNETVSIGQIPFLSVNISLTKLLLEILGRGESRKLTYLFKLFLTCIKKIKE